MTGDDRGLVDGSRRALLKGLALGAVGTAGASLSWPHVAPHVRADESEDRGAQQAMNDLVATDDATHVASGGRWADGSSWEGGSAPEHRARVHVPSGTTVTLDHEDDVDIVTVRVDGTLGTTDDTRAVYRTEVDGGTAVIGDAGDSRRMYTVFYRGQ